MNELENNTPELSETEGAKPEVGQVVQDVKDDIASERSLLALALGKDPDMFKSDKHKMWGIIAAEVISAASLAAITNPMTGVVIGTTLFLLFCAHYLGAKEAGHSADYVKSLRDEREEVGQ